MSECVCRIRLYIRLLHQSYIEIIASRCIIWLFYIKNTWIKMIEMTCVYKCMCVFILKLSVKNNGLKITIHS